MQNLVIGSKAAYIVDEEQWQRDIAHAVNVRLEPKSLLYIADTMEERLAALRIWKGEPPVPEPPSALDELERMKENLKSMIVDEMASEARADDGETPMV